MSISLNEKPNAEQVPRESPAAISINGKYLPPPQDGNGKLWVRTSALIELSPQKLYEAWRDVESAPLWQAELAKVIVTGPTTSHWIMNSDDGSSSVEWDAEVLADEPGKRIVWRSVGGDVDQAGEIIFEGTPTGDRTTVTILQEYRMGKVASALKAFRGRNPKQAVIETLRHFKAYQETGEIPCVQGQPHGPRGVVGSQKESLYGEKIATPPAKGLAAS
jgi:uncharacterized membrane protein